MEPLRRVGARTERDGSAIASAAKKLARPVPAPAVAQHREEVVGCEEAAEGDEDEQAGGGLACILPPAHP
uniref:Uncharacterized protein n=1 Tax=Arundo donax TaxID=35708 RepID=A0A0A9GCT2_ARUDO